MESLKRTCNYSGEMDREYKRAGIALRPKQVAATSRGGLPSPAMTWRDLGFCVPRRSSPSQEVALTEHAEDLVMPPPMHPTWSQFLTISQICQKWFLGFFCLFVSHSSCCFWIVYGREGGNISVTSPSTIGGSLRGGKPRQKVGAVAVGSASIRYLETVEGRIQNWEHRGTVGGSRALRHQMARPAVLGEALTFTGAWSWKIHWQILKDFKQGFN